MTITEFKKRIQVKGFEIISKKDNEGDYLIVIMSESGLYQLSFKVDLRNKIAYDVKAGCSFGTLLKFVNKINEVLEDEEK